MGYCFTPLQVCAMRVALLDSTGNASPGASNGYASKTLIDATLGIEIEEGEEILQKNSCGEICVNFKDSDRIKRATVQLNLCALDADLVYLLTGSDRFVTGGNTIGGKIGKFDDSAPNGAVLELWSKAWDGSEQGQISGVNQYIHWILPRTKLQFGEIPLGNTNTVIPLNGTSEENSALNIDGPFNDWPTAVTTGGGADSALAWYLDGTLPTQSCEFITVPAQGS